MTKICLGCNKEYADEVDYCPDCLARSRDINKRGNTWLSIGFLVFVIYSFMHNFSVILSLGSLLDIPRKIVAVIGFIFVMVGIVMKTETFHNYELIEKEKYENKIFVKNTIIRFIRYFILTAITVGFVYFLIAY